MEKLSISDRDVRALRKKMPRTGLEPATLGLKVRCSATELTRLADSSSEKVGGFQFLCK